MKRGKPKETWRILDLDLEWVRKEYPQLEDWRELASRWAKSDKARRSNKFNLQALSIFLGNYLIQNKVPIDPKIFLLATTEMPDFFETSCPKSTGGALWNNRIVMFLDFVLQENFSIQMENGKTEIDQRYRNPFEYRNSKTLELAVKTQPGINRGSDLNLVWVSQAYPDLEAWRALAVEWLHDASRGLSGKLTALGMFLEKYLIQHKLPLDFEIFFAKTTMLPAFYETACTPSMAGVKANNYIHGFLKFVLREKLSMEDDHDRLVIPDIYHNPVPQRSYSELPRLDESVHSPLPYGYIDSLRLILASGPNFSDWAWAQTALGFDEGKRSGVAPDWFPVGENQIDPSDPDCVFRVRKRILDSGGDVLEMWSPVRWVALLVKLLVPLRTFQVRTLDSGEADTWRWERGQWELNTARLAKGTQGRPHQQGVLRRYKAPDGTFSLQLYINTNKTADIAKSGPHMGFTVPWPGATGPHHRDVYYWLEKLRNWQEKYNPISRQTSWAELDDRHVEVKSDIQLAAYPDACFLFRQAETLKNGERLMPLTEGALGSAWYWLLTALEKQLADQGATHADGTKILLVPPRAKNPSKRSYTTHFPLHSLRVSMVTALALDGQVPFPILMKAVGHSRLLMTLYYVKPGAGKIGEALADGLARLEANREQGALTFLRDTEYARLLETAICNNPSGLVATIPANTADRNPAGWMDMGYGMCLVGGNISELEENRRIGGCFNGGPVIHAAQNRCGPVPGGPRNCVRCRWFVTMPHYLPALAARFNNLSYQVDEAIAETVRQEETHGKLDDARFDAAKAGTPFDRMNELNQVERLRESALGKWSDLAESLVACWRLIERCFEAINAPGDGMKLISIGSAPDVQAQFEETDSELLQLSGVCDDLELFPDLEPGKAILRRSQLLDAAFANDGQPPMLLRFSEQEQLLIGNAVMRQLGRAMNPSMPEIGKRQVIALIEAGERIGERLGVNLAEILAGRPNQAALERPHHNGGRHALHDRRSS